MDLHQSKHRYQHIYDQKVFHGHLFEFLRFGAYFTKLKLMIILLKADRHFKVNVSLSWCLRIDSLI